jgi:hypothetical protein
MTGGQAALILGVLEVILLPTSQHSTHSMVRPLASTHAKIKAHVDSSGDAMFWTCTELQTSSEKLVMAQVIT